MTRNGEKGFTLIETLVALIVLAMVAGGLQLCLAGGWRGVKLVRTEQAALHIARAELAAAGIDGALAEGTTEGNTDNGYAWTREVTRRAPDGFAGTEQSSIAGYWITVAVRWQEGPLRPQRFVILSTLKLGRVE